MCLFVRVFVETVSLLKGLEMRGNGERRFASDLGHGALILSRQNRERPERKSCSNEPQDDARFAAAFYTFEDRQRRMYL